MGSSEIWDKYHECCIGNGDKFHKEMGINFMRRSRVKFTISNTTRVVFIPNFTATHAIFPVNTILLHIHMLCISIAMYAICHYVLTLIVNINSNQ